MKNLYAFIAILSGVAITQTTHAQLPNLGMDVDLSDTALVITDPQNDFLSPDGVTWGVVGKNVTENNTVEHIGQLFASAKARGMLVAISPHYYYPHDHVWEHEGTLETLMHKIGMFDREGPLVTDGVEGSGADWLEHYKPYIEDESTLVTSPHKVYGPESNDLVLQLRKRGISKVILGGMSANLCTESHMRELMEQGFQVAVVPDATGAAIVDEFDGFKAAYINYRMIANTIWSTEEALEKIRTATGEPKVTPFRPETKSPARKKR
ncbi:isochorismatase family protein [Pelagicoccus sp. SDUM812002]|uniref:isochorismatase family protein n=1 Tax=Pelagicoccus sp. SDUM812002 TaxID=3041266 RepID=UPI00280F6DF3|nr:isochorismatase family protein [Pelagicoccus sp. SDUM812002]MDQ8184583.1 isochorismatase family protein [Pelagicoccus sp. SDUM812002]